MKHGFKLMMVATLIAAVALSSCRKKKKETPRINYTNGITDGTYNVEDKIVDETVNVIGGNLIITGETRVTSDINMKKEGGSLQIHDTVQVHKINMHGGVVTLTGSPTIRTDFNHTIGIVYVGNCNSTLEDTVTVKVNYNFSDTLFVLGGVLVIEHDLNQNPGGVIDVEDGAKLIVRNHFNVGGPVYGTRNIEAKVVNINKHELYQEPLGKNQCNE